MFRKSVSLSLLVILLSVVASGILMGALEGSEIAERIRHMHAMAGLMIGTLGIIHLFYNIKLFLSYLKQPKALLLPLIVILLLVLAFVGDHEHSEENSSPQKCQETVDSN